MNQTIPGRLPFSKPTIRTVTAPSTKSLDQSALKPGEARGYLKAAELAESQVQPSMSGGYLVDSKGKTVNQNQNYYYVIDPAGRLFVQPGGRENFYHSSFLGGEPVISAGFIKIRNGKVAYIDNMSGHYKPGVQELNHAVGHLRAQGLVAKDVSIVYNPRSLYPDVPSPAPGGDK